jgi:hypothetical protein
MVAGADGSQSTWWKWALLTLCALSLALTVACAVDVLGAGGPAWFGWWDANTATVAPYTVAITQPRPDGAVARAGLRDGDRIDLRDQSLASRIAILYQPLAMRPTALVVRRGPSAARANVVGSTTWQTATAWKLPPMLSWIVANVWFALCAVVIALRRWQSRRARAMALVLLLTTGAVVEPTFVVVPSAAAALTLFLIARSCATIAALLLVRLISHVGTPAPWRIALSGAAYAAIVLDFLADLAQFAGIVTLRIDPLPFVFRGSLLRGAIDAVVTALVFAAAAGAVASSPNANRSRAAWLLLPLPLAFFCTAVFGAAATPVHSWFGNIALITIAEVARLLGALIVTYALLNRRVLDSDFVLSRTLVVAAVSLIVVAAFVLLDWVLGDVLVGVSHATGLFANGALALALGLSLNAIQKRVTTLLDSLLFRKRHEDERALLGFSREAAYATEPDALMDRTIENLQLHTDARGAALLLDTGSGFRAARTFGNSVSTEIEPDDAAILALKTWHKPLDPHRYGTSLHGALAVPMVARGRLCGLVLLGERIGGEAYAPNEVEALSQFALGVGSALDALSADRVGSLAALQRSMDAMTTTLTELRDVLTRDRGAPESP